MVALILSLLLPLVCLAQANDLQADAAGISQAGSIRGQLNDANPRDVYFLDGLRGEVIGFELSAISADLDPTLTVFDETGELALWRDDSAGGLGAQTDLSIARSGRYFIIVGRFGQQQGRSSGEYALLLNRKGVLSERGSSLRYGDSVIGTISDANPEVYYTFQARQGDILTISMLRSSGTLDPYLQVVDGERFVIAQNDDQIGADTRNARIDALIIARSGTYIIAATRYDNSAGSFVLTLEETADSGRGSTRLAPLEVAYGDSVVDSLDNQQFSRYYSFTAAAGDLVTIDLQRGDSGDLDAFVTLADINYQTLIEDDDSGEGQNARIADYRIPFDGRYHIIATRYEGATGATSGEYRLALDSLDNPFADLPPDTATLNYGTSVTGTINADNPADLYVFYGRAGEVVSISMTRVDGNLDAYLELLDNAQEVVAGNDDGGNNQNALIANYALPRTGMYTIRARRFSGSEGNPDTSGAYVLVLAERQS
ncbi:MAG: PPC domain-containing protein [Chloroflexota bacterium]|nr:PPC domain-containing protein [Chloroflexota bacterium]MDE2650108.1 PPC domain-containing protein [Chloroflexota bacterium]